MKICMVAPEVSPFVKEGGLADVVGSLPKALADLGHDVRIICPRHGSLRIDYHWKEVEGILYVPMGGGMHYAGAWETHLPGRKDIPVYFIEYDEYFARGEVYHGPWGAHGDNDRRFAFFNRAALELCQHIKWWPDVMHGHDWTSGLLPIYLNTLYYSGGFRHTASVFTIHNLEHQGHFSHEVLHFSGLPESVYREDGIESAGGLNWLKGALYHANKITTVSPRYAKEIQTPEGGFGLDPVLRFKSADLIGVLNGMDSDEWDPSRDGFLPENFSVTRLEGKKVCKAKLQEYFGLVVSESAPLLGIVSRLFHQKGLDLLASVIDRLLYGNSAQIVLLGSGEKWEERAFSGAADRHKGRVGVHIGFDPILAHGIFAGSDFFMMPSRFEPCGLGQMYAMKYGSVPIVRKTGGLADTVIPYPNSEGRATGFHFQHSDPVELLEVTCEALRVWQDESEVYSKLQSNGMKRDFSWKRSALEYEKVYGWAKQARG